MRARWLVPCLVPVLAVACGGAASTPDRRTFDAEHTRAIEDSVATALAEFQRLSAAAEWDSVLEFYSGSPDFRFYEDGVLRYRSAEEVGAALAGLPPGGSMSTEYRETRIRALAPGLASVGTLYETSFGDPEAGAFSWGGAVTMVWTHETGGWRILGGHSSSPNPASGR